MDKQHINNSSYKNCANRSLRLSHFDMDLSDLIKIIYIKKF